MNLSTTVIYADKSQQADECIRNKLKQLKVKETQSMPKNILLITGDRILVQ